MPRGPRRASEGSVRLHSLVAQALIPSEGTHRLLLHVVAAERGGIVRVPELVLEGSVCGVEPEGVERWNTGKRTGGAVKS